ncbi:MAG: pentapeptide repeat-containing protein [Actinomycetota bacterium]
MRQLRTIAALIALALIAAACSSADGELAEPSALATQEDGDDAVVPAEGTETEPAAAAGDPIGGSAAVLAEADAAIELVRADCAERGDAVSDLVGEPLGEAVFDGPSLICARLSGIDLADAEIGVFESDEFDADGAGRLDLSGADLSGADLRGARLSIDAVGASFVGADLRGADFADSDLRGADFSGANLVGSTMTAAENGLTRAVFFEATMGCNVLVAGPGIDLRNVFIDESCDFGSGGADEVDSGPDGSPVRDFAFWNEMTLRGTLDAALLPGFDFSQAVVEVRSYRGADMTGALLTDEENGGAGLWPDGSDFTGANLTGASLVGTGFVGAIFDGADLTGANLTEVFFRNVSADGAVFSSAVLRELWAQRTSMNGAILTEADLTDALLDRVDLTGADLFGAVRDGLELSDVVCPSGVATIDNVGSCDVGDNFDLSVGAIEG